MILDVLIASEQDIGRLQVAMENSGQVGGVDRSGEGDQQCGGLVDRLRRARRATS